MIPITLITGFLGSGKTTLVSRLYQQYAEHPFVYLVNEFSEIDIDGQRLAIPDNQLVTIPGGSIFCRCLVSDFVRTLQEINTKLDDANHKPEGVIIEASGISDPNVMQQLLHETKLDSLYALQQIVCVIDPGTFHKLILTLPNIIRQVQASHTIIINKIDLHTEEELLRTETKAHSINPEAMIVKTKHCDISLDLFAYVENRELSGEYALCKDPRYASVSLQHEKPIQWELLKQEIEQLPENPYRVKGYIQTKEHTLEIDFASGVWTETITLPHSTQFVIIIEGRYEAEINIIQTKLRQHLFDEAD